MVVNGLGHEVSLQVSENRLGGANACVCVCVHRDTWM
jgi:hypothetical protein